MITKEADYAIRALLYLSKNAKSDVAVSSQILAKDMGIPYRFMRKIGLKLAKSGLIVSRKGKGGGLVLEKEPREISILDVLRIFDPDGFKLSGCLTEGRPCDRSGHCKVHSQIERLQTLIDDNLAALTFETLL